MRKTGPGAGWDEQHTVKSHRTGEVGAVILWTTPNGGNKGDGHGRWVSGSAAGQWETGDILEFILPSSSQHKVVDLSYEQHKYSSTYGCSQWGETCHARLGAQGAAGCWHPSRDEYEHGEEWMQLGAGTVVSTRVSKV
jgi:hypothetical protein